MIALRCRKLTKKLLKILINSLDLLWNLTRLQVSIDGAATHKLAWLCNWLQTKLSALLIQACTLQHLRNNLSRKCDSLGSSAASLFKAAERVIALERLLNLRHGARAADDCLPPMFFEADYSAGHPPSKPCERIEPMVKEFYAVMGWSDDGRPGHRKLTELNLDSVVDPDDKIAGQPKTSPPDN